MSGSTHVNVFMQCIHLYLIGTMHAELEVISHKCTPLCYIFSNHCHVSRSLGFQYISSLIYCKKKTKNKKLNPDSDCIHCVFKGCENRLPHVTGFNLDSLSSHPAASAAWLAYIFGHYSSTMCEFVCVHVRKN